MHPFDQTHSRPCSLPLGWSTHHAAQAPDTTIRQRSDISKIQLVASEVVKVVQVVLDATIRLCRKYFQAIKWDTSEVNLEANRNLQDGLSVDFASHVTTVTACAIRNLYDLGILAAAGGGSMVTILNVSWKGVVSLLQCGKNVLADKVNIGDILLTLISLANESLKCAAETWLLSCKGELALSEAKRTYLPIKFYLINAVRISSEHPCQAMNLSGEISKCLLLVTSFGVLFSKEVNMRAASEALADVVEPTSHLLLHAILNSADIQLRSKLQILDSLFTDQNASSTLHSDDVDSSTSQTTSFDGPLAVDDDGLPRAAILMLGRVMIFLNLLKSSSTLNDEVTFAVSKKLGYLLNCLTNEDVYSLILGLHVPVLCGSVPNSGIAWEPLLTSVLHALKTFMIVASSSSTVWKEVEDFLVQNLFHSHCFCMDIVVEMWCFFMRHAEIEAMNDILDKFCSLLKVMSSSQRALKPLSSLRTMARSVCSILAHAMQPTIDHVFCSMFNDDTSYASSITCTALMMEGFPLSSLSDSLRKLSAQKITMAFHGYIATGDKKLNYLISPVTDSSIVLGLPVHCLSSALHNLQIMDCDINDDMNMSQVFSFAAHIIEEYKNASQNLKDHYGVLLGATLDIIASMKQFYVSSEIRDVVLELHALFTANSSTTDTLLYQCKPMLASFLAGLRHMNLVESDEDTLCLAVSELYHMLFRERHWAFIHLALVAFRCFAAQTSCGELWRLVPDDAALSYDTDTGNEPNEERFMSQMMVFLQKEVALGSTNPCKDQLHNLVKEGALLRRKFMSSNAVPDVSMGEMQIAGEDQAMNKKKRKLPEEISAGILMLQNGLKFLKDGLSTSDSIHLKEEFSTHISCLEDVILHLNDKMPHCGDMFTAIKDGLTFF
ncbi:hypothetical protein Taro_005901 [Colocasia esculenta]|uniref:Uncharacterized protein n=1 Tax=Colocasia esculenta TaxID=4460 RepID=A0A843TUH1_COLES|nr:hypothetical protein [Colocasia esculenta]